MRNLSTLCAVRTNEGTGHWFPCQSAGTRAFGSMPERRPILQKGDNFHVPEKSEPQRYVAEFMRGNVVKGGGRPEVAFVREFVQPVVEQLSQLFIRWTGSLTKFSRASSAPDSLDALSASAVALPSGQDRRLRLQESAGARCAW
jgi:hypothetical protein